MNPVILLVAMAVIVYAAMYAEHRKWFAMFHATGTWGSCPVRFIVPDTASDLVTMIQRELVKHYVEAEFG